MVTSTLNTWPGTDFPPADVNSPATYTDLPSAAGSTFQTFPTGLGAKAVSSLPVVASNARRLLRVTVVEVPWFWAWVNWPPTTIVLPTWAMEKTEPSRMFGALLARLVADDPARLWSRVAGVGRLGGGHPRAHAGQQGNHRDEKEHFAHSDQPPLTNK